MIGRCDQDIFLCTKYKYSNCQSNGILQGHTLPRLCLIPARCHLLCQTQEAGGDTCCGVCRRCLMVSITTGVSMPSRSSAPLPSLSGIERHLSILAELQPENLSRKDKKDTSDRRIAQTHSCGNYKLSLQEVFFTQNMLESMFQFSSNHLSPCKARWCRETSIWTLQQSWITARFAWSQVQQEDWDGNSAEPSFNCKMNHWLLSLLMLTFIAWGCTTLGILELSEMEETGARRIRTRYVQCSLLFTSLIPRQNTLDLNQTI